MTGKHFLRGQRLFQLQRYREAAEEYLQEISGNPEFAPAYIDLAAAQLACQNIHAAEQSLRTAMELGPEEAHAFYVLSYLRQARNDFRGARQAILEAIRLCHSADYQYRLAEIYAWRGRRKDVLDSTAEALQLDPTHVPSILLRGKKLQELHRHGEANELFSTALRENPEFAAAHHAMGKLQLSTGDAKAALQQLTEARRLDPVRVNDQLAIAEAYGLNLPLLRSLNRFVLRWHLWSFRWKWLFAVVVVAIFCIASTFTDANYVHRTGRPQLSVSWVVACLLLTNYLMLPYSLSKVARSIALVAFLRGEGTRWRHILFQPVMIVWILGLHAVATMAGAFSAAMPEMFAIAVAVSVCYPYVFELASGNLSVVGTILCFGLLVVLSIFAVFANAMIAYADEEHDVQLFCTALLGIYFAATYFNDKVARRLGRLRILKHF